MLTIGQLAAYAGVTPRAVRHYHHIGLLPEPERDVSGYRSYDAQAVVDLIRIRTLAEAGVPLSRVGALLGAGEDEFAAAVDDIDRRLRADIRELQEHRRRVRQLSAGDSLALPPEVVGYLGRLRAIGVPEQMLAAERDAWILVAARWPERIGDFMVGKMQQLEDERTVRIYGLIAELVGSTSDGEPSAARDVERDVAMDEARLVELADVLAELVEESAARGELDDQLGDDPFVALLDAFANASHPLLGRLQGLMAERGWTGWTHIERAAEPVRG